VKIDFQVNTVNGTFTSAISIAMIGGIIAVFPYIFWEIWLFIKPALSPKEKRYGRGSIFLGIALFFYRCCFWLLFVSAIHIQFPGEFYPGQIGNDRVSPIDK
jgi:sec-independent protein translocase protein TatC